MTERRTPEDFVRQMKWLVDEVFSEAEVIREVLDNLHTPTPAALYQTFPPAEAGVALDAQAWLMVKQGGDRVFHFGSSMPAPPFAGSGACASGGGGLGRGVEGGSGNRGVAFSHGKDPKETPSLLSSIIPVVEY